MALELEATATGSRPIGTSPEADYAGKILVGWEILEKSFHKNDTICYKFYRYLYLSDALWAEPIETTVLRIRIRSRIPIHRIHMFLGLQDPDPLVRGMDPDPIMMQK